jgi:hypothetical protein
MLNIKRATIVLAFAGLSTVSLISSAHAAGQSRNAPDYGILVTTSAFDRVINVDAGTKYVNVTNGETVRFNANGQMFIWHFDTFPTETQFDLSKIASANVTLKGVQVYVANNPQYYGL